MKPKPRSRTRRTIEPCMCVPFVCLPRAVCAGGVWVIRQPERDPGERTHKRSEPTRRSVLTAERTTSRCGPDRRQEDAIDANRARAPWLGASVCKERLPQSGGKGRCYSRQVVTR